ncbi:MAG: hypothetical protein HAW67_06300 [Endozoicomonadaceae bacterium]|nr:hypothetical protein [Endozoicomonadaceae bacterium]
MDNNIYLGNFISAMGAFCLFLGNYQIGIKNNEKKGITFSGIGSFILCLGFYILNSSAFLLLNVIWTIISIYGYKNRSIKIAKHNQQVRGSQEGVLNVVLCIAFGSTGVYFTFIQLSTVVAWISISLMLVSYFLFALNKIKRFEYILFSVLANILCLTHLTDIQNYSSLVQTVINLLISSIAIYKNKIGKQ